MSLFPYVASAISFSIGVGAGLLGRYALGRSYPVLITLTLAGMTPWLGYNLMYFRHALQANVPPDQLFEVKLLAYASMACLLVASLVVARRFPIAASLIPAESFLLTWWVVIPRLLLASPSGRLDSSDNVASVWLFIFQVCLTGTLFSYWSLKHRVPSKP